MSLAGKSQQAAVKPAPAFTPTVRDVSTLQVIERRLLRACDLLSCLEYCRDGELNLGALAIATRDLIDTVRDDLAPIRRRIEKTVQP
jgi:hypothetical protein